MGIKGVMIAAPSSGTGKTTVSIGIMRALADMGLNVQPFKVGPDYIDTGFHRIASGNISHNLDSVMGNANIVKEIYYHNSAGKDISIVEGVMGLFDGKAGNTIRGSSFEISLILGLPVVMVIDISASGRSAAALVKGFKDFDKRVKLRGVILNRAGSDYHCNMVKNAIEATTGVKVLGCIKRNEKLKIGSRHLGLVTAAENRIDDSYFKNLSLIIRNSIDLDQIIKISSGASSTTSVKSRIYNNVKQENCRIGVAYNRAFTFYYPENIELLKKFGAKIIYFDPIADTTLPDVDGIYIGGGYPEIYAKELSGNTNLMAEIRRKLEEGMPAFAECGGYMYLSKSIEFNGVEYPMVGSIPAVTHMENLSLGYRTIETSTSGTILKEGEKIKGHEFHYSRIVFTSKHEEPYRFQNGKAEGYVYKHLLAGYAHLYFPSNQNVPRRFVMQCKDYRHKTAE